MKQKLLTIIAACLIGVTPLAQAGQPEIQLTKGTENDQPGNTTQSKFLCTDTVFAVLNGNWPSNTEHKFEAYWTDPQGKQQKHSRQKFTSYGSTRVWIWLRLHRGDDNAMTRLFGLSEDSMQEFVGEWKVDFYLDGKKVSRSHFTVVC